MTAAEERREYWRSRRTPEENARIDAMADRTRMFKVTSGTGQSLKLSARDAAQAVELHIERYGRDEFQPEYVEEYVRVNAQDLQEGDYCHASKELVVAKAPIYPGDKHVGLVLRCQRRDTTRSARWGRYTKIGVMRDA